MIGISSQDNSCRHAIVKVRIQQKVLLALADAGATITLVRADIAKDLKLPLYKHALSATGVTNDALKLIGRTAVLIKLGKKEYKQCMYVAEYLSHEVILGTDFLAKLGEVAYNFDKCILRVGDELIPMGRQIADEASVVQREEHVGCEGRVTEELNILPFSEALIVAQVESTCIDGRDCLFEGDKSFGPRHILIGKSVSKVDGAKIRIPVMNAGPSTYTLRARAQIGNVETLETDLPILNLEVKPKETPAKPQARPGDSLKQDKTDLTDDQMSQLRELVNEFADIVGENIAELGRTSIVEHVIETVPDASPVRSRPYNIPVNLKAEVKSQIDKMLDHGLIRMSTGAWSSPIVLVKKKDGTWRFCVDYRKLNKVTVKHSMASSSIENAMEIMHGKKFFSSIELSSGFYQVALHEDSQEKSSFITPWGSYAWTVMPMGASGSPSTFTRLALAITADLISEGSSCIYVDDWLLSSKCFEQHLQLLRTVFTRLRFAGIKYRFTKSYFCQREITYLGHVISQKGIAVSPHNTEKIREFPTPKDRTGVRRLLGLFEFYRTYIKNFSKIAAPLIALTKETNPFVWSPDCEEAATILKQKICSAPILAFPNFKQQFVLTTDASAIALGAVLSQEGEDGKMHPVSFYSKALSPAEQKWDACELELYAILCAVKHYKAFLVNAHFKVLTDNVACTYIVQKSDLSPKLARWAVQLADYSFEIEHKAGKENVVADALSRATVNVVESDEDPPLTENDRSTAAAQGKDYYLSPIVLYLAKSKFPADASKREISIIKEKSQHFKLVRSVLYRIKDGRLLLAVPATQRQELLYAAHESLMSMHPGLTKTMLKLSEKYWFPGMRKEVGRHIAKCGSCQHKKNPKLPIRVPLKNQMAERPFQVLSVDFQGPFVESDSGNKHILVWVDHFTKWCEMEATTDQRQQR